MKAPALLLAACVSLQAFAQTDTTGPTLPSATYTPLFSLSRADIERLPATDFLQLVQGAFPFMGNVSLVEEDYAYVTEDFIAINPNAINLSQIESIRFYPAGTALTRGSLGRKGTIVIRLRPQKNGFDLSSKTGLLIGENSRSSTTDFQQQTGFASLNELGYRHTSERFFLSTAASYLRLNNPETLTLGVNSKANAFSHSSRIRLSGLGGMQLSKQWGVEAGGFFTTQPAAADINSEYDSGRIQQRENTTLHALYASGHAGLRFSPSAKLSNHLTAEMSYAESKNNGQTRITTGGDYNRIATAEEYQRYYVFSNAFTWKPLGSPKFNLEASVVAHYRFTRGSQEDLLTTMSGSSFSQSGSYGGIRSRSFALSPGVVIKLHQLLTAEAGLTYDDYRHSSKAPASYNKLLPNGGICLNLQPLLKDTGITTLELSSTYQKYLTDYDRIDLLGTRYRSNLAAQMPFGGPVFSDPQAAFYGPSNSWVSSLAVGWWKNRLILKGSYRYHDGIINTFVPLFGGANMLFHEPLKAKNWSVELKTVLMEKPGANWTLTAMAFHDKYERKNDGNSQFTTPVEALFLDAGKAPVRGGLRTAVTLRRFYLQAAALVNLNEAATDKNGVLKDDITTYQTNFLLAGYTWPLQGKRVKGIDVNLQSENLLHSGTYAITKYVGLGVQVHL